MSDFGPLGGVKITGFISPTDTNDEYAVTDPLYGIDGLRNLTGGTSDLNAIPDLRRRAGMLVGINSGNQYYKLNPPPWGGTISDWVEVVFSGGSSGATFSISGATDSVITSPSDGDILSYSGNVVINVTEKFDYFTATTESQTVFSSALSTTPLNIDKTQFFVNGVKQRYGVTDDYVITGGTSLVWVSDKHNINPDDELAIIYL